MSFVLTILVVFGVIVAALALPVAIRDRRRARAEHAGHPELRTHPSSYSHADGVTAFGGGGFGGGFDGGGGGCGGGDGGGGGGC